MVFCDVLSSLVVVDMVLLFWLVLSDVVRVLLSEFLHSSVLFTWPLIKD